MLKVGGVIIFDVNKKSAKKIILITVIIIIIYIGISLFFKSHFYFGTIINGINISGKTVDKAEKFINTKV